MLLGRSPGSLSHLDGAEREALFDEQEALPFIAEVILERGGLGSLGSKWLI